MLNFTKEVLYEFETTFNFAERNISLITPDVLKLYMVLIKTYFLFLRVPTNEPFDDMDGSINAKNSTLRVVYFTLLVSSISFFIVIPSLWPLLKRVSITINFWILWSSDKISGKLFSKGLFYWNHGLLPVAFFDRFHIRLFPHITMCVYEMESWFEKCFELLPLHVLTFSSKLGVFIIYIVAVVVGKKITIREAAIWMWNS